MVRDKYQCPIRDCRREYSDIRLLQIHTSKHKQDHSSSEIAWLWRGKEDTGSVAHPPEDVLNSNKKGAKKKKRSKLRDVEFGSFTLTPRQHATSTKSWNDRESRKKSIQIVDNGGADLVQRLTQPRIDLRTPSLSPDSSIDDGCTRDTQLITPESQNKRNAPVWVTRTPSPPLPNSHQSSLEDDDISSHVVSPFAVFSKVKFTHSRHISNQQRRLIPSPRLSPELKEDASVSSTSSLPPTHDDLIGSAFSRFIRFASQDSQPDAEPSHLDNISLNRKCLQREDLNLEEVDELEDDVKEEHTPLSSTNPNYQETGISDNANSFTSVTTQRATSLPPKLRKLDSEILESLFDAVASQSHDKAVGSRGREKAQANLLRSMGDLLHAAADVIENSIEHLDNLESGSILKVFLESRKGS